MRCCWSSLGPEPKKTVKALLDAAGVTVNFARFEVGQA
jgi:translation elongation factor EF-Ts